MTKKRTTRKSKPNDLDTMFPDHVVKARGRKGDEVLVTMNPLPLDKLPLVMDSFQTVVDAMLVAGGDQRAAGLAAVREAVTLLPYCMDVELKELAATSAPDLLSVFIDQNITDDMLGKWMALAGKINKRTGDNPILKEGQPSQSSQS